MDIRYDSPRLRRSVAHAPSAFDAGDGTSVRARFSPEPRRHRSAPTPSPADRAPRPPASVLVPRESKLSRAPARQARGNLSRDRRSRATPRASRRSNPTRHPPVGPLEARAEPRALRAGGGRGAVRSRLRCGRGYGAIAGRSWVRSGRPSAPTASAQRALAEGFSPTFFQGVVAEGGPTPEKGGAWD